MSRSAWTHVLCDSCWAIRNGDRVPHVTVCDVNGDRCCQCGKDCRAIFIREDPALMRCKGVHRTS
jgi:hypothetical protein